jgi:hypothetical protein
MNIPMEFVGLARAFWRKVEADDKACGKVLDQVEAVLTARLRKKPSLRPEHVIAVERLWATMPSGFALSAPVAAHPRKRLHLSQFRLTAHLSRCKDWAEDEIEHGVSLTVVTCETTKRGGYRINLEPVVTVCLHALARRFQRGRDRSEAAVLTDLSELGRGFVEQEPGSGTICVPGGQWRGGVSRTEVSGQDGEVVSTSTALTIRTFIDGDSLGERFDAERYHNGELFSAA